MTQDDINLKPWSTGWEPMPRPLPRVSRCPACRSVPLWRHMLRCYWLICTNCGLSTAAFRLPQDAAAAWNLSSRETDRVVGSEEITLDNMDEIIGEAIQHGCGSR